MTLPEKYHWLHDEAGPRMLKEALKLYGVVECDNVENNPVILEWAKEVGRYAKDNYTQDSIPWCGLFVAVCAVRSGWEVPHNPLWAMSWAIWARTVAVPMLGDVLVFTRNGGGHVGLYVGEDADSYHVLGGNQSDAVTITRILKTRLVSARRPLWRVSAPQNIRRVYLMSDGGVSKNEA